jgi:arylsulfatase A-like enzyme
LSRRGFVGAIVVLAAALLAAGCDARAKRLPSDLCLRCNVVLVSFDTLRADHVGFHGYRRATTPNLDRFAGRAVVFENAISQSAWTRPSHASMFTGLYPSEHGLVAVERNVALDPGLPMLASVLRANGYATAAFTGGGNMSAHFGFDAGFDIYRSPGRRMVDGLGDVEAWLDTVGNRPFFLFVHGYDAHRPYRSTAEDRAALGIAATPPTLGINRVCRKGHGPADVAPYVDEYDAAIHHGDRAVGRLLESLARRGRMDDTVVVITSDHGEEFLEHGACFHIRSLYREAVHVPLVYYVPGVEPGRVSRLVPASVSVAPTILDLVGVGKRLREGPSLAPFIDGRRVPAFDYVVSETAIRYRGRRYGYVRALTGERDKVIRWTLEQRDEYYDLTTDPGETHPLRDGAKARPLLRHLDLWLAGHPPRDAVVAAARMPAQLREDLRALGYVE